MHGLQYGVEYHYKSIYKTEQKAAYYGKLEEDLAGGNGLEWLVRFHNLDSWINK